MAEDLFHAVKRGHVTIDAPQQFPLAEAAKVHAALEGRQTAGSIVLIP